MESIESNISIIRKIGHVLPGLEEVDKAIHAKLFLNALSNGLGGPSGNHIDLTDKKNIKLRVYSSLKEKYIDIMNALYGDEKAIRKLEAMIIDPDSEIMSDYEVYGSDTLELVYLDEKFTTERFLIANISFNLSREVLIYIGLFLAFLLESM